MTTIRRVRGRPPHARFADDDDGLLGPGGGQCRQGRARPPHRDHRRAAAREIGADRAGAPVTPSMSVQSANQPSARRTRVLAEPTSAARSVTVAA